MKSATSEVPRTLVQTVKSRLSRLNLPARASLFYTLSSVASRGLAFLFTPLFTRIMEREALGQYSLFTTYLSLLSALGSLELCTGVLYSLLSKNEKNSKRLMRYALLTVFGATLVFSIPLPFFYYTQNGVGALPLFYLTLLIASLSRTTLMLFGGESKYRYRYKLATCLTLIEAMAPPLLSLLLVGALGREHFAAIRQISLSLVLLICALPIAIKILRAKEHGRTDTVAVTDTQAARDGSVVMVTPSSYISKILRAALPTLPYFILISLIASSDKIIIANTLSGASLAEYGVAYSLGSAVTMLCAGVSGIMTPWIMRKYRRGEFFAARNCALQAKNLIALATLIFLCFAPELFKILAPSEYLGALSSVYPIALCSLPLFLSGLTAGCLMGYEKRLCLVLCALVPAALSIAVNLALTQRLGIIVSAITSLAAYQLLLLLLSLTLSKISGKSLVYAKDYLQTALISAYLSGALYILKDSLMTRILIAILLTLLLVPQLAKAKNLLREKNV